MATYIIQQCAICGQPIGKIQYMNLGQSEIFCTRKCAKDFRVREFGKKTGIDLEKKNEWYNNETL